MQLGPKDEERLRLFQAAELARRTLERGLRLNAPEAVSLVCDEMHMAARGGAVFEEVSNAGRHALRPEQVLDGVADLVPEIRVEVLLEEGTRLVVLREPFGPPAPEGPGAVVTAPGQIELVPDRERLHLMVRNTSRRPVRVSSHYPFWQANRALEFDRSAAHGFRLDLPAGDQIRWGAGQTREVILVRYAEGSPER